MEYEENMKKYVGTFGEMLLCIARYMIKAAPKEFNQVDSAHVIRENS